MAQLMPAPGKEAKYFRLFEEAPVAIWDEDFSGVKTFLDDLNAGDLRSFFSAHPEMVYEAVRRIRVRHVNRLAREFYGADTSEHVIEALPRLFDSEAARVFIDELVALAEGRTSFSAEFLASTLRGEKRLVQMNVSLLDDESRDWSQVVVAFTDLTERRRLEESVERANQALRRMNADLEQFAYTAAHDLREPLRTIALYGQFLSRLDLKLLGSDADTYVRFILDNAKRMESLIGDLLALAAVGTQNVTSCPVADTHLIVHEVLKGVKGSIDQTNARIYVEALPPVQMQPNHVRQLFQNLIVNGIKYSKAGETPQIYISGKELDREIEFCVADNGVGIALQEQQRIFEVFYRLHARAVEGTGIGLALCKKIVEEYRGRIWVESAPGAGSKFRFAVPKS